LQREWKPAASSKHGVKAVSKAGGDIWKQDTISEQIIKENFVAEGVDDLHTR
jgi:hypothetical protein